MLLHLHCLLLIAVVVVAWKFVLNFSPNHHWDFNNSSEIPLQIIIVLLKE